MPFGFGHLSSVMAAVHPDEDAAIIEARLKYLQRLPFPSEEIKVGKGQRAYYSVDQLLKLVVAFELMAAGVIPAQAAGLVAENWDALTDMLAEAWTDRDDETTSMFLIARPDGFGSRRSSGSIGMGRLSQLTKWHGERGSADRRIVVVNLLAAMRVLHASLDALANPDQKTLDLNVVAMRAALEDWARRRLRLVRTGT